MNTPKLTNEERERLLKQEFAQLPSEQWGKLTSESLFGYLDMKTGRPFDMSVGIQVWEQMHKNPDETSTVDEFIRVYIQAEDILRSKIQNADNNLVDYHAKRKEAMMKLEEIKQAEVVNLYGVMEGSTLTVADISCHNLRQSSFNQRAMPLVSLECEGQHFDTSPSTNFQNPAWPEVFVFQISSGIDDLKAKVLTSERQELLGQSSVKLGILRDQQKLEEWFDLVDQNGVPTRGRIRLTLQWVYSKAKYMGEIIKKWDQHIKLQDEEKQEYKRDLEALQEPFYLIQEAYYPGQAIKRPPTIQPSRMQTQYPAQENPPQQIMPDQMQQQQQPYFPPPPMNEYPNPMYHNQVSKGDEYYNNLTNHFAPMAVSRAPEPPEPAEKWQRITNATMIFYVLVAVTINLLRADFLDVIDLLIVIQEHSL
eukprot:TRINITY_DN1667_c0_g1_i2.p1 TRINITY_DN1667_c0_g1~~TRINITY_DN1667_c0_g1_i2.p1  ORF type:complete len:422 (-),score=69.17 TRINITY_DN1667_c0_g1_i2:395-1660(-)